MKNLKWLGWTVIVFLCSGRLSAQSPSPNQLTVPLSSPGKPYTLNVSLLSGAIKVTSYAGKEILIDVIGANQNKNESKNENVDAGNGMKRITPKNGYDLTAREDKNSINVSSGSFNQSLKLNLKVPQDVKLKLSTVNGGDIDVDNIRGELEINNVNGAIKLTNISGSVVATTVNGNLIVTFNEFDSKSPMAFSTLNGNVDVTFPTTIKSNVKLKSDRGEIYTDFNIDIQKSESSLKKTTEGGLYQLKMDDWVIGKINGGGPEILMKNMQGNIYLRKAK